MGAHNASNGRRRSQGPETLVDMAFQIEPLTYIRTFDPTPVFDRDEAQNLTHMKRKRF